MKVAYLGCSHNQHLWRSERSRMDRRQCPATYIHNESPQWTPLEALKLGWPLELFQMRASGPSLYNSHQLVSARDYG